MPILAVAPHWGAWIEMQWPHCRSGSRSVAPHWGAWIEINSASPTRLRRASHPTGVRGLKLRNTRSNRIAGLVAPHWGAWIEIAGIGAIVYD